MLDEDAASATAISNGDLLSASQSTLATEAPLKSAQKKVRRSPGYQNNVEDSKGPLNEDSSSNVLFHPPAAHEEHSEGSDCDGDSAIAVGKSSLNKPKDIKGGAPHPMANQVNRESSTTQETGQGKKRRKRKNKKKKKNN